MTDKQRIVELESTICHLEKRLKEKDEIIEALKREATNDKFSNYQKYMRDKNVSTMEITRPGV